MSPQEGFSVRKTGREIKKRRFSKEEKIYAREAINEIVSKKISKYNNAPIINMSIGRPNVRKVLLLDQRYGDMSVIAGMADEKTFERMLLDAINNYKDADIIIKLHPDAIKGGKSSYFGNSLLSIVKHMPNIYLVDYNINSYSLLSVVSDVFVCTSGMGFEALMAGKKVHCYGVPFYSGWGITDDKIKLQRRKKYRTLEEIFYVLYCMLSRYFNPRLNHCVDVKNIVNYIYEIREGK